MSVRIEQNRHGKARVRLVNVRRRGDVHDVREIAVRMLCEGDFEASYRSDDNSKVLPTDTMKNTVYALARRHPVERIERFGETIASHLLETHRPVERVTVDLVEHAWVRIATPGREGRVPHPHAFVRPGGEVATASVSADRRGVAFTSGLQDLEIMKTAASGFVGFPRAGFTTLGETRDRILRTVVSATWEWRTPPADFAASNSAIRDAMLAAFAGEHSPSIQFTLQRMAEAALERVKEIERVHLSLPNRHCLLVDLSIFGLDNPNEVFVATDEPHGLIEATVSRA
jgi:urate oxidase